MQTVVEPKPEWNLFDCNVDQFNKDNEDVQDEERKGGEREAGVAQCDSKHERKNAVKIKHRIAK